MTTLTETEEAHVDAAFLALARLREAIELALNCTPLIAIAGVRLNQPVHKIVYDCGDPWEILRAALSESYEKGTEND